MGEVRPPKTAHDAVNRYADVAKHNARVTDVGLASNAGSGMSQIHSELDIMK